jgi:hypothetical protein
MAAAKKKMEGSGEEPPLPSSAGETMLEPSLLAEIAQDGTDRKSAAEGKALSPSVAAPSIKPTAPTMPAPSSNDPNAPRAYRIWPHGTMERDGVTYKPGATIELRPSEAHGIGCLEVVEG